MIGNKLQQNIIGLYNDDISRLLSIHQIAKLVDKTYPTVYNTVQEFFAQGILNKVESGRSHLCSINLENEKAIMLLALNEIAKKEKRRLGSVAGDIHKMNRQFRIDCIIKSGKSLVFVLDHIHDQEAIKNIYKSVHDYDLDFIDREGFRDYLIRNPPSKQQVVLSGYEQYYSMLATVVHQLIGRGVTQ